jgi:hypothetical protein
MYQEEVERNQLKKLIVNESLTSALPSDLIKYVLLPNICL